jgi:hypothetical protein
MRRAIVDRDGDRTAEETSPKRDDPFGAVLTPEDNFVAFAEARTLQARGKSVRGPGSFCVRIRTRPISIVVHEKVAAAGGDIVKEIK